MHGTMQTTGPQLLEAIQADGPDAARTMAAQIDRESELRLKILGQHRLSPDEMIESALGLRHYTGNVSVSTGFIDGLVELLLLLPIEDVHRLRAAHVPALEAA